MSVSDPSLAFGVTDGLAPADSAAPYPRPSQAWFAVVGFCVAAILSYTDRQILSLLVDPLRAEFHLSDTQVGVLQGIAFALIYAFAGLPLGRLADILPRRRVIIGGVLLWSVATLWCALSRSFGELFLARTLVGIGEAALAPSATSMIADYFPARRRGTATGVFVMGQIAGSGVAIALGGTILQLAQAGSFSVLPLIGGLAPWRATMMVLAMPGLLVAALLFSTHEPPRRRAAACLDAIPVRDVVAILFAQRRTLGPIYLGMALLSIGDFSLQNWIPTLLSRGYGLSPGAIGAELGPAAIAGALIGTLAAGFLSDRLVARADVTARLPVAAIAAVLAIPGGAVALAPSPIAVMAVFLLWLVMSNAAGTIGITAIQELAPESARGVALALISFFNMLTGLGFGTTMTAVLTDHVYHGAGGVAMSMTTMAVPAAILGALAFTSVSRTSRRSGAAG